MEVKRHRGSPGAVRQGKPCRKPKSGGDRSFSEQREGSVSL